VVSLALSVSGRALSQVAFSSVVLTSETLSASPDTVTRMVRSLAAHCKATAVDRVRTARTSFIKTTESSTARPMHRKVRFVERMDNSMRSAWPQTFPKRTWHADLTISTLLVKLGNVIPSAPLRAVTSLASVVAHLITASRL
jgi:hypothetical protein